MKRYKFKSAEPCYTGGGIYAYIGETENGVPFVTSDEWGGAVLLDCRPDDDNSYFWSDWLERHQVGEIAGDEWISFMKSMFRHIIRTEPSGPFCNYSMSEIEDRLDDFIKHPDQVF